MKRFFQILPIFIPPGNIMLVIQFLVDTMMSPYE